VPRPKDWHGFSGLEKEQGSQWAAASVEGEGGRWAWAAFEAAEFVGHGLQGVGGTGESWEV
jgi:hypothetical protein